MRNYIAVALVGLLSLCESRNTGAQPRPADQRDQAALNAATTASNAARIPAELEQDAAELLSSRPTEVTVTQTANLQFDDYWRRVNAGIFRRPEIATRGPLSLRRMLNPVRFKLVIAERAAQLQSVQNILCLNNGDAHARPFSIACYFAGNPTPWTRSNFPCQNGTFEMVNLWPRHCHHRQILTDGRVAVKLREEQRPTNDQVFVAGTTLVRSPHVTSVPRINFVRQQVDQHLTYSPPVTPAILASFHTAVLDKTVETERLQQQQRSTAPTEVQERVVYRDRPETLVLNRTLGLTNVGGLGFALALFLIQGKRIKRREGSLGLERKSNDRLRERISKVVTKARQAYGALKSQKQLFATCEQLHRTEVDKLRSQRDTLVLDVPALEGYNRELETQRKMLAENLAQAIAQRESDGQIIDDLRASLHDREATLHERECENTELRSMALARENDLAVLQVDLNQTRELFEDRNTRIKNAQQITANLAEKLGPLSWDSVSDSLIHLVSQLDLAFQNMRHYQNVPNLINPTIRPTTSSQTPPVIIAAQAMVPSRRNYREDTGAFERRHDTGEVVQTPNTDDSDRDSWVEGLSVTPKPTPPTRRRLTQAMGVPKEPARTDNEPTPSGVVLRDDSEALRELARMIPETNDKKK